MKKLSPYEQLFYDDFESGLTWAGISVKRKVPFSEVMEIRYEIMKKGYDVKERSRTKPEEPAPTATAPAAVIKEEGKHMEKKEKRTRKRLTEEEKAAIVEYKKTHTKAETEKKFGVSSATVYYVCKCAEGQAATAPNDAPTRPAELPGVVHDAITRRIFLIEKDIDQAQRKIDDLEKEIDDYNKERESLQAWLAQFADEGGESE